jgi:hypothetical protein
MPSYDSSPFTEESGPSTLGGFPTVGKGRRCEKSFKAKKFPDDRQGGERIPETGPSKHETLGLSPQPLKIAWL